MRWSTHAHLSKKCTPIVRARRRCHTKPEPCVGSSSESRFLRSGSGKKQSLPSTSRPPRRALTAAAGGCSAQSQASSRHAAGFSGQRAATRHELGGEAFSSLRHPDAVRCRSPPCAFFDSNIAAESPLFRRDHFHPA